MLESLITVLKSKYVIKFLSNEDLVNLLEALYNILQGTDICKQIFFDLGGTGEILEMLIEG